MSIIVKNSQLKGNNPEQFQLINEFKVYLT